MATFCTNSKDAVEKANVSGTIWNFMVVDVVAVVAGAVAVTVNV
jgi:hypothetical protein